MSKEPSMKSRQRPTQLYGTRPSASGIDSQPDVDMDVDDAVSDSMTEDRSDMQHDDGNTILYCNFCADVLGEKAYTCKKCGAMMCQQRVKNSAGCVEFNSFSGLVDFLCPHCHHKKLDLGQDRMQTAPESRKLSYRFSGYSSRVHSKLTWPMVLICCELKALPDMYLGDALALDMNAHYHFNSHNLNAQTAAIKNLAPATKFLTACHCHQVSRQHLHHHRHSLRPADRRPAIQWWKSKPGQHAAAPDLLNAFIGSAFLGAAKEVSQEALRQGPTNVTTWYNRSAHWRGGWRCLVLATCGPAMRVPHHFDSVKKLVSDNTFDLVVGFGGSSTLPTQVKEGISKIVEGLGVNKVGGIWELVCDVIGNNWMLLKCNSVIVVFKERGDRSQIVSREIGLHNLPWRLWGVEFRACGTVGCNPHPENLKLSSKDTKYRVMCTECHWQSPWVKTEACTGLLN
ncbi:hypothetical protein BU15DRAFT_64976 [Melanogaster broomeanus]|nr:hypothetical protein BU15DRAFT_64976 [Melanogaster broomeanus]